MKILWFQNVYTLVHRRKVQICPKMFSNTVVETFNTVSKGNSQSQSHAGTFDVWHLSMRLKVMICLCCFCVVTGWVQHYCCCRHTLGVSASCLHPVFPAHVVGEGGEEYVPTQQNLVQVSITVVVSLSLFVWSVPFLLLYACFDCCYLAVTK